MNAKSFDQIRKLRSNATKMRTLVQSFKEATSKPSCDKHDLKFGGDNRFSVFSTKIFLSCYTGYYGNSGCSILAEFDHDIATHALNAVLNAKMPEILAAMADVAEAEAVKLKTDAEKELQQMQTLLDQVNATEEVTP